MSISQKSRSPYLINNMNSENELRTGRVALSGAGRLVEKDLLIKYRDITAYMVVMSGPGEITRQNHSYISMTA